MDRDETYTREHLYVALQEALNQRNRFATMLNSFEGGNHKEDFTPGTWLLHLRNNGKIKIHGENKKATA